MYKAQRDHIAFNPINKVAPKAKDMNDLGVSQGKEIPSPHM